MHVVFFKLLVEDNQDRNWFELLSLCQILIVDIDLCGVIDKIEFLQIVRKPASFRAEETVKFQRP